MTKAPVPAHRQGIPSMLYWLVDRLEVLRTNQLVLSDRVTALDKTVDLLIEYEVSMDERIRYMQRSWDDMVGKVAELKTLPASVKAGFAALDARVAELNQKLADAIAAAGDSITKDEVDAVLADVSQAVADLKTAIPANT